MSTQQLRNFWCCTMYGLRPAGVVLLTLGMLLNLSVVATAESEPIPEHNWKRIIEKAKREGPVTVYTGRRTAALLNQFEKKYPDIKIRHFAAFGAQISQRLLAEQRAGKYVADIYISGSTTGTLLKKAGAFAPIKPELILPEVVNQSKWWQGKHHYVDSEREYIFTFNGTPEVEAGYNTNLVNPKEFKSFWDFVNPRWKGKIVAFDPKFRGVGNPLRFMYYHPELGPKFLRRLLGEMDITFSRDARQIGDWLGVGKFAIHVLSGRGIIRDARNQGLPVDSFVPQQFKEGGQIGSGPGNIALIRRAPHPNAAKVFINWLLSREGQVAFQRLAIRRGDAKNSLRIDIPKDDIPLSSRRLEGINYLVVDRSDLMNMKPIYSLVDEALRGRKRK